MEKQYARFEVEFTMQGEPRRLECLISEQGVRRVFEVGAVPGTRDVLLGQDVVITTRGLQLPGVFTREILPESSFYNIRFRISSQENLGKLREQIREYGFSSPWQRTYPRIPAEVELNIGLPTVALVESPEGVQFFKVINFTLGGLLIESEPDSENVMSLGHRFYFQLMVSDGNSISGIWGKIVRIDEESIGGRSVIRYGVQIVSMSSLANKKYRTLIVNYCEKVKQMYKA